MAKKFKMTLYTGTVEDAFESAKSEIESLKEEMEQWRNNMEDSLSHTSKYDDVSECCDYLYEVHEKLEEIDLSELPGGIGDTPVTYTEGSPYGRKPVPRWMRLSNAQSAIDAVKSALEAARDGAQEDVDWETPIDALDEALSGCPPYPVSRCECCEKPDTETGQLCDGCDCCQECCNCTSSDCDCDACKDRRNG